MPRLYRQDDRSQEREYDRWLTQYIHDNSWLEYIQADQMYTDGPRILLDLRSSTIVLSPTIERFVSATLVKRFFWLNGKIRLILYVFPSTATLLDLEVTLSLYSFEANDLSDAGTLLETQTVTKTFSSAGLQELVFQMDTVVVDNPDIILGFTINHDPNVGGNTYADKSYLVGAKIEYQPLLRQQ